MPAGSNEAQDLGHSTDSVAEAPSDDGNPDNAIVQNVADDLVGHRLMTSGNDVAQ